jgi:hypothetical protein
VPEGLDVSIQLPKLNVVTINELLSELDSFDIIGALQIDTTLDVTVWTHDIGAVILHCGSSYNGGRRPSERHRAISHRPCCDGSIILPSSGGRQRNILLQLRNFLGLAQVAELELAAPDKQKSGQPARLQQPEHLPSSPLREQLSAGRREGHEGPGFVHLEPAALDRLIPAPYSAGPE